MFTEKCEECQLYEVSCDDEFDYCGSTKWETDDFGNMVEFVEEKHCDFKPKQ